MSEESFGITEMSEKAKAEDHYETVEMVLKSREDGVSWFDYFFDLITENCEGDPESEENDCTCGLETMGGSGGTLEQCYEYGQNLAAGISPIMVAQTIMSLWESRYGDPDTTDKVIEWARKEIEFEDWFENRLWEEEEDDEVEQEI